MWYEALCPIVHIIEDDRSPSWHNCGTLRIKIVGISSPTAYCLVLDGVQNTIHVKGLREKGA